MYVKCLVGYYAICFWCIISEVVNIWPCSASFHFGYLCYLIIDNYSPIPQNKIWNKILGVTFKKIELMNWIFWLLIGSNQEPEGWGKGMKGKI